MTEDIEVHDSCGDVYKDLNVSPPKTLVERLEETKNYMPHEQVSHALLQEAAQAIRELIDGLELVRQKCVGYPVLVDYLITKYAPRRD